LDRRSLSQTAQQFGMLLHKLVNSREKRGRRSRAFSLKELNEQSDGLLLCRGQ